jgi:hypothetical protein
MEKGDGYVFLPLADYYIRVNRDSDAMPILDSLLKFDSSATPTLRMAGVEFRLGKRDQAMRRLDDLLAREPHNTARCC